VPSPSPSAALQIPRFPSPSPRPAAHSVPAAANTTSASNGQQHHLISPRPQHGVVNKSPITGPVRRLEITLDPAGIEPLRFPALPPPLSSATPPILAPSPRVMRMSSFFAQSPVSSATPPPSFGVASPSAADGAAYLAGRASMAPQQRSTRLRRRRTAVVAHGDFNDSIPEEWRNADEHGEDEGVAPQIGREEEVGPVSPRIRVRRASLSMATSTRGRGGLALNARRTLLSVDLDRFAPAQSHPRGQVASPGSSSDMGSSTPAFMGNLDAAFFSPSSAHSSGVSTGEMSVRGSSSVRSIDSSATPLSFASPLSSAISAAAAMPPTYRRHSVTGAAEASVVAGAILSHPRVLDWAAPPLERAASLGSVAEAPFA